MCSDAIVPPGCNLAQPRLTCATVTQGRWQVPARCSILVAQHDPSISMRRNLQALQADLTRSKLKLFEKLTGVNCIDCHLTARAV